MNAAPSGGWTPGVRPAWVRHVLAGEGGPIYEPARRRFEPDQLQAEAASVTGLDDFGGDSHLEGLGVLCTALEDEADLHLLGRWRARGQILRLLENRLRIVDLERRHPELAAEVVAAPLVVTGSPRAGTSITHQLLSLTAGARAPLAYEFWRPAPPPTGDPADPRIAAADLDVRLTAALSPGFDGIHEQGGLLPRECPHAMAHDFRADIFGGHYWVPTYEEWLTGTDFTTAYDWHRRILAILQLRRPTRRWVLKAPGHLTALPTLLATYPDASVVICHRDPLDMVSSVTSLLATLHHSHADHVDAVRLAASQSAKFAAQYDRLMEWLDDGTLDPERLAHQHFAAFNDDPVAAVAAIHERFDLPFDDADRAALVGHLGERPRGRLGGHDHDWSRIGLDHATERARFARYQDRFGVPSEVTP